jgi:hypothetical protein
VVPVRNVRMGTGTDHSSSAGEHDTAEDHGSEQDE